MNRHRLKLANIVVEYPDAYTLGDLMTELEQEFMKKGEVVCQFFINQMALTEEDEKRMQAIPIDEIESFEVDTENPAVLLFTLLQNWINELPQLIRNIDQLSKDIRFKGIEGRIKDFVDMVDTSHYLIESLIGLESILQKESMNLEQWKANKIMTARAIGSALTAFEKKDFVQLSEILEYDLGNSLQEWLEEIVRMKEFLEKENDKDSFQFANRIFQKRQAEADKENSDIGSGQSSL